MKKPVTPWLWPRVGGIRERKSATNHAPKNSLQLLAFHPRSERRKLGRETSKPPRGRVDRL